MLQEPQINHSLSYRIWRLNKRWQASLDLKLAQQELNYPEFVILSVLIMDTENAPGPKPRRSLKQKYVQDLLGLDKMSVSRTMRTLSKKMLVYRLEDIFDTRSYIVFPTPKGRNVFKAAYKVVAEFDKMQQRKHAKHRG